MRARPKRRLAQTIVQTFCSNLTNQASQILAGVVVARALGPEAKGLATMAGVFAWFAYTLLDGLNGAIGNQAGARGVPMRRVWKASLPLYASMSSLGSLTFALLWLFHRDELAYLAVTFAFPCFAFLQMATALYAIGNQTERFNTQNALSTGVGSAVCTILAIVVFHAGIGVVLAIWVGGYVAGTLWALGGMPSVLASHDRPANGGRAALAQPFVSTESAAGEIAAIEGKASLDAPADARAPGATPAGSRALTRTMAIFGAKSSLSATIAYLSIRVDTLLVAALTTGPALGIYTLAIALAEVMWMISRAVTWAAMGRLASLPLQEATRLTARVVRTLIAVQLVMGLVAFAVAPLAIDLVYGARFHDAGGLLRLLLPGTIVYSADGTLIYFMGVRLGLPGLLVWLEAGALAVCAALTLLLLPRFGLAGAAVAHTLTFATSFAFKLAIVSRKTKVPVSELLVPRFSDVPERVLAWLHLRGAAA